MSHIQSARGKRRLRDGDDVLGGTQEVHETVSNGEASRESTGQELKEKHLREDQTGQKVKHLREDQTVQKEKDLREDQTAHKEKDQTGRHEATNDLYQRRHDKSPKNGIPMVTTHENKRLKHELLHSKPTKSYENKPGKPYENQWELEQYKKATQITSSLVVEPTQEYDYVFDESQFVDFGLEDLMEGDDSNQKDNKELERILSLDEVKKSLPVYTYRDEFLQAIGSNQVLIVVGETGSGKTTQLPQYLHEAGYSKDNQGNPLIIGCTQPRRVAATSVATRVADEMNTTLGQKVGYSIRFDDKSSNQTVIKYMTDGMLLREFLNDPKLTKYGAIMIDEAHERTLSTEILLSLLKDIATTRPALKLIIASATINASKFSDFFGGSPILNIPGRRFPVEIFYTKSPEANYAQAAITTIFQIHITENAESGDILVFLTGQEEIELMEESLQESISKLGSEIRPLLICPIYANLPNEMQSKIFEPTPKGSRKVVLATNIAETSITIPGVAYVIDPGYVKQNAYNPSTGMESLVVVPCSRASADQRAGRAGRVGPGKCFRLFTKWSFYHELEANPIPEILRSNLVSVLLLLLSLGINDLINFDFMDAPSSEAIIKSLELLYALGALSSSGGLTKLGKIMSDFPIDPMFTKTLITGNELGVFEHVLSVVSILGESSTLFYRPKDKKDQADKAKERFKDDKGDHLTLLRVWNEWVDVGFSNQWCQDYFIQYKTMRRIKNIREQLLRVCEKNGMKKTGKDVDSSLVNSLVQKSIVAGFFPNVVRLSQMGDSYRRLKKNQVVSIHPSSGLYVVKPPPKLVLYHELVLTSKEYMRNCMIIESSWVKEYAEHYYSGQELGEKKISRA